ncbi:MAG: DUF4259 domain-containing protein [Polyangiaceae bacterium]|nr:DUF4259 domain-containing protein [Polyangiaceae bacterium]
MAGAGADALASVLTGIAALDRGEYLDVDDATAGVAAAELVAAAHGTGDDRLSPAAKRWLGAAREEAKAVSPTVALRAVERIYAASELRDLWSEGSDTSEWHDHMRELSRRLEALE